MDFDLKEVRECLPMSMPYYVKAPCMRPFRPILYRQGDEYVVHTEILDDVIPRHTFMDSGFYVPVTDEGLVQALSEYQTRVSEYLRHVILTVSRGDEGGLGLVPVDVVYRT